MKIGLAFYRSDTDKYQDIRIKRLKKQFKGAGIAIYDYILTEIYRVKGCYIEWNSETLFDVSDYFDEPESFVAEVVSFCVQVGLFDAVKLKEFNVLTSASIQRRYLEMCQKAKRNFTKIPEDFCIECDISEKLPEEMRKTPEETPKTPEEIDIVKYSIVKNSREDDRIGATAPTSSTSSAGQDQFKGASKGLQSPINPDDPMQYYRDRFNKMSADQLWVDGVLKSYSINALQLKQHLTNFFVVQAGDHKVWKDQSDCNRHFRYWLQNQPVINIEVTDAEILKKQKAELDEWHDAKRRPIDRIGLPKKKSTDAFVIEGEEGDDE